MNCYVSTPKDLTPFPSDLNKDNTLFYPEAGMTLFDQFYSGRPDMYHIVTDSPFLVSLYSKLGFWYK